MEKDRTSRECTEAAGADRDRTGEQQGRTFFQEERERQTRLKDTLPRYVDMKRYTSRETKEKRRAKR